MPCRTRKKTGVSGKSRALRRAAQDQGVDRGQIRQGLQATLRVLVLIPKQCDYHGSRTASAVGVRALTRRWHFEVLLILSVKNCPLLTVAEQRASWGDTLMA